MYLLTVKVRLPPTEPVVSASFPTGTGMGTAFCSPAPGLVTGAPDGAAAPSCSTAARGLSPGPEHPGHGLGARHETQ